jgi:hypothetical protein
MGSDPDSVALKMQGDFCDRKVIHDATLFFANTIGVEGEGVGDTQSLMIEEIRLQDQWIGRL